MARGEDGRSLKWHNKFERRDSTGQRNAARMTMRIDLIACVGRDPPRLLSLASHSVYRHEQPWKLTLSIVFLGPRTWHAYGHVRIALFSIRVPPRQRYSRTIFIFNHASERGFYGRWWNEPDVACDNYISVNIYIYIRTRINRDDDDRAKINGILIILHWDSRRGI